MIKITVTKKSREQSLFESLIKSVSTDETRWFMNGIYVDSIEGEKVKLVATDGRRLFLLDLPLFHFSAPPKAETIYTVEKIKDSYFFADEISGTFPSWKNIIPNKNDYCHVANFDGLVKSTKRRDGSENNLCCLIYPLCIVNHRYLLDVPEASMEIHFHTEQPSKKAIVFKGVDWQYLIMPLASEHTKDLIVDEDFYINNSCPEIRG